MEVVSSSGLIASFLKGFATLIALFSGVPSGDDFTVLPMRIIAETEQIEFLRSVSFAIGENQQGRATVYGSMTDYDTKVFAEFTLRHLDEYITFVVCDEPILSARIVEPINGGQFLVSGAENDQMLLGFLESGCP
ncbi:MAG: hypothetical protein COB08_007940 [Rhodobacteraceae bacterium]|nr:hypothetical protein [Paracoccaceae bacterium]